MFLYAAEQGQKEAEWMIHWGCQHGLLKLDLQVDVSAIQLVAPQTSKEEFRDLYYQVYKLRRLAGSPLWGLEWMEKLAAEIVSSLKDHLGQKEGRPLWGLEEPGHADIQPPRSKTPRRGRRDTSAERDLAEVREAHQRALATMATLEKKIERLSWSITQGWLMSMPTLGVMSAEEEDPRDKTGGTAGFGQSWVLPPSLSTALPCGGPGSGEDEEAKLPLLDFYLEPLPELGQEVIHFCQEPAGSSEEDDRNRSSPEHPVEEYERWVTWWAWVHDTPGWWPELAEIPGVDDHQELAWKVQASFELPWQISEWHGMGNYHQASPALPCIYQKDFHSLIQSLLAGTLGSCS